MRFPVLVLALLLALPASAASLRDLQLEETLQEVAEQNNQDRPRRMNEHIVDEGLTVSGTELINFLSVQPDYAEQIQGEPLVVRTQLQASVCRDQRLRRLMDMGATLTYHFVLSGSTQPVLTQSFIADHCQQL
ncbi:Putative quorum-sensing-regulated virulence factor [Halopseudomonas xinjiangensis]|uniref:Putative quorum-sensing-regulated virulence factor n=1 Tax=Halopseudomonas xinjiangensis TaxID=487184 RepID=A0A1H1UQT0_9GAMM|nr:PA3611 family quorum-sensing-regulated virulence factor [Halopseudomonas xinjiangensis]SDS74640.1 Putative quorum-sensing-regulated virulence factor [Halopseudomonas xinjiangensis]